VLSFSLILAVGLAALAACLWVIFGWSGESPQDRAMREAIDTTTQTLRAPLPPSSRR